MSIAQRIDLLFDRASMLEGIEGDKAYCYFRHWYVGLTRKPFDHFIKLRRVFLLTYFNFAKFLRRIGERYH